MLEALNLYWSICPPPCCFMALRTKFCPWCYMWAYCQPKFLLALLAGSLAVYLPRDNMNSPQSLDCAFFFSQESIEYGKTRGSHGSHKIYLPFGLDYNNNMSESPHGTLIWSNCLQKNQSHAFFLKNEGERRRKKPFIFILLASLIFFYFSLTFRK